MKKLKQFLLILVLSLSLTAPEKAISKQPEAFHLRWKICHIKSQKYLWKNQMEQPEQTYCYHKLQRKDHSQIYRKNNDLCQNR